MTEQNEQPEVEVLVGPLVKVAIHGEEDLTVAFSELNQSTHGDHDPAMISNPDLLDLVAAHMDISVDELAVRAYGRPGGGKLEVGRPETGNIMVRPETVLG